MSTGSFTVRRIGDVYVVSDDGRIAKSLGLGDAEWHLVAPRRDQLADQIDRMAGLVEAATAGLAGRVSGPPVTDPLDGLTTDTTSQPANIQFLLPTPGSVADRPVEALPASKWAHRTLRKRGGIETIGQLAGFSEEELLKIRGMGKATVAAAKAGMKQLGYRLKQPVT